METYNSWCMSCEERTDFTGEVIEVSDGTSGAQGPCPKCGTLITQMISFARKS